MVKGKAGNLSYPFIEEHFEESVNFIVDKLNLDLESCFQS